jgi:hypothetical protein
MGIIMVNYECESLDNGRIKWKVVNNEKVVVVTTSEEVAVSFYNDILDAEEVNRSMMSK